MQNLGSRQHTLDLRCVYRSHSAATQRHRLNGLPRSAYPCVQDNDPLANGSTIRHGCEQTAGMGEVEGSSHTASPTVSGKY